MRTIKAFSGIALFCLAVYGIIQLIIAYPVQYFIGLAIIYGIMFFEGRRAPIAPPDFEG